MERERPIEKEAWEQRPAGRRLLPPGFFVVRINLYSKDGLEAVRAIRSRLPGSTVVGVGDENFSFDLEQLRALRDAGVPVYPPAPPDKPFTEPIDLDELLRE